MCDGGRKDKAAAAAVAAGHRHLHLVKLAVAGMCGCAGKNDGGAGMAAAGTPGMGAFGAPTPSNV